jgi:hypothetical protein
VAKAAKKATTSRFITLLQAKARIGWDELQFALETGRLLAYQTEDWARFEELHHDHIRRDLKLQGARQEDFDAVRAGAIGYPASIPRQSWRRWFAEGSVNRRTGKVIRRFVDRGRVIEVTFQPVLLNTDVPERRPAAQPTAAAQTVVNAADQAATKYPLFRWLENEVRELKRTGKLPDQITACARLLEPRLSKAADSDKTLRRAKVRHIENMLRTWGLFPKKRSK